MSKCVQQGRPISIEWVGLCKQKVRSAFVLILLLSVAAVTAWSQSQAINGTIRGRLFDASGAAVAGGSVEVRNTDTGFRRTVQSNEDGYYVFPNLPLGTYEVVVTKQGFSNVRAANIRLEAGREAVVDAPMKPATVETVVEVSNDIPIVQTTQTDIGRTISTAEVENLPLTSRNPYNFILFQPGVSGHPNPELGIPRTINTNGLLDRINYQMDGMVDTQADRHGLRLYPISQSFVREVQTISNSFAPEFGNTTGNIYNVITNSGTNTLHGSFNFLHRWVDATARPILLSPTAPKPQLKLTDYAGNVGGPVVKDKLFWFVAYEHLDRGNPVPITITPANATALGLDPKLLGSGPGLLHGQFLDARLDWVINSKNTAFVRYNYFRNSFPFNTSSGSLSALDAFSDFKDHAHVAGFQLVSTLTQNLLNEFRFSAPYRDNTHFAGSLTGPGPVVNISGVAVFNGTTGAGDRFNEKIPNFNENLTWIHGTHSFKFGGYWQENVDFQRATGYTQYTFSSIANYNLAQSGANPYAYSTVQVNSSGTLPSYKSMFFGMYAQDSWHITPNLMLIYGLRWDKFRPPDSDPNALFEYSRHFNSPSANFSPRFGFAYSLNSKTVVRGSAGVFYENPATNTWFNALLNNGHVASATFQGTSPGAPAFPTVISSVPAPSTPPSIWTVSPNFKNAYTLNFSLQVQRELSKSDALTVGYVHTAGRNLEFLRNMNLINPIGTLADGRPIFSTAVNANTRLYPQFNSITLEDSGARSNYDALVMNYTHRMAKSIELSASYTWSHSISTAPEANGFEQNVAIEDPTNMMRDRANSLANRPQALTISAVLQPTWKPANGVLRRIVSDNTFAILGNISSGDQQNILSNVRPLNGDAVSSGVTRPLFVGRNSVRGPNIYQIDLRYTRDIATLWERVKPQFLLEANNLFNHPNITTLNTSATVNNNPLDPNYGAITADPTLKPTGTVLEGRIVQVGLAVRF
jgi:Carboxypeptidase regulatory-like domain/TonB dependent receptor